MVDREPVVIFDDALSEQAIARDAGRCAERPNGHHHAWLVGMLHPSTIDVGDAHREYPPVAVDVLRMKPRPAVPVAPWPRAHARAVEERSVGERVFYSVGVDARCDVERARAQRLAHRGVARDEPRDEIVDDVQRCDSAGDFDRVDVGIDPMRRFRVVLTAARIGDGGEQQVAPEVRLAITLDRQQGRVRRGERPQPCGHLVVSEESVEVVGHSMRVDELRSRGRGALSLTTAARLSLGSCSNAATRCAKPLAY